MAVSVSGGRQAGFDGQCCPLSPDHTEETMERRTFLIGTGALGLGTALGPGAFAQGAPEKSKVTLGVGGKPLLYYLPLTIAERKGFFKEQGLEVEINDFGGGAKSLQALVGGSVDVV